MQGDAVYTTGWFRSTVDFGGGPLAAQGFSDVVLAAYTTDGVHLWSQRFGSDELWGDMPVALAADRDRHVFVTGTFWNEIDLGDGRLVNDEGPMPTRATFLASFGADGSPLWSSVIDSQTQVSSSALGVRDDGRPLLAGGSAGDVYVDGTTRLEDWPAYLRPFAMSFDPTGGFGWASFVGSSPAATCSVTGIGARDGIVYVAGSFERTLDVGSGEWTAVGERDGFLTVLAPP